MPNDYYVLPSGAVLRESWSNVYSDYIVGYPHESRRAAVEAAADDKIIFRIHVIPKKGN
jgi:hypothetical protein